MREIKFRAFDEQNKVMHYDVEFIRSSTDGNDWIILKSNIRTLQDKTVFYNPYFQQQIKIIQYTGLKDKNGVEIYEGDIVRWGLGFTGQWDEESRHRYAKVEFNPDIQFKIIYYIDSKTMQKKETDNYIFQFGRFAYQETERYLEVIGNIYENPELLETK